MMWCWKYTVGWSGEKDVVKVTFTLRHGLDEREGKGKRSEGRRSAGF